MQGVNYTHSDFSDKLLGNVIFGIDVMSAGGHHASMKMQRAEHPKASAREDSG